MADVLGTAGLWSRSEGETGVFLVCLYQKRGGFGQPALFAAVHTWLYGRFK